MKKLVPIIMASVLVVSSFSIGASALGEESGVRENLSDLANKCISAEEEYYSLGIVGNYTNIFDLSDQAKEDLQLLENPEATDEQLEAEYNSLLKAVFNTGFTGGCVAPYLVGDVNHDDEISILDVTLIQKELASCDDSYFIHDSFMDANRDLCVSIDDATDLQKYIAEMPAQNEIGTEDIIKLSCECDIEYFYRLNSFTLSIDNECGFDTSGEVTISIKCNDDGKVVLDNAPCKAYDKKVWFNNNDNRKCLEFNRTYTIEFADQNGTKLVFTETPQPFKQYNTREKYTECQFYSSMAENVTE